MSILTLQRKKTPYSTARDLKAIFTEFNPDRSEWTAPLVQNLGGRGRSEEGLLKWLLAHAGLARIDITELVYELAIEGCLSDFFIDDAAIDLIGWGLLKKPCEQLLEIDRQHRFEAEVAKRQQQAGFFLNRRLSGTQRK